MNILNLSLFLSLVSASGSISEEWYRIWGGNEGERGYALACDYSGNIFVTGSTSSFGAGKGDICLVKYDSSGVQQWNRTWGGSSIDIGQGIAVDSSDNIYIAGQTDSFGVGYEDACLVKYDNSGVQLWNLTWGDTSVDLTWAIALDSSGDIYIAGTTHKIGMNSDMFLVKFNSSGVQQWNRTWGRTTSCGAYGIALDSSDNIYLAGFRESGGNYDMCLVKYDSLGNHQWDRTWGGKGSQSCHDIAIDSMDNIYLVGSNKSLGISFRDMCLVKYDSSGEIHWISTWGSDIGQQEAAGVSLDSNDDIYLVGYTFSFGAGKRDICIVKFDKSGILQWNHTWGGIYNDWGYGIAFDQTNNLYIAGVTESFGLGITDMCLLKISGITLTPIAGYDLFIFLSIISIVSVILIKKCYKLNKKYN